MADATGSADEAIGYAEALRELEAIVSELEGEAADVDHLSARVRRASELIGILRDRISSARMEVTKVVAGLDAPGEPDE